MTETTNGYAQPRMEPRPPPVETRSVGPVTLATGGAAAATALVCWILSLFGIDVPGSVQGSITILLVLVAGYAVPPRRRGRYSA